MQMTEFVDLVDIAKSNVVDFMLWPDKWAEADIPPLTDWFIYPFLNTPATQIPNSPGIYFFLVQPRLCDVDASFLVYLGRTNKLRRRFSEYRTEANDPLGRPKVRYFLNKYKDYLHFSFTLVANERDLPPIEDALVEALMPPANPNLPATVRRVVNAF